MKIEYSKVAAKQIRKLPKNKRNKAVKIISLLKQDPLAGKRLKGEFKSFFSIRVWPYRIIYRYFPKEKLIFINTVEHRQGVYK